MNKSTSLLGRMLVIALGVLLAANLIEGISYDENWVTLFLVVVLLTFFNTVLKPLLMLFTLPFIILTFGLGIFVINALLLGLVAWILPTFTVEGFGSAFLGAVIISLTSFAANMLLGKKEVTVKYSRHTGHANRRKKDDDVIDI